MPKTVLVVDDDESIRELLVVLVSRAGFNAVPAASGEEAIEKLSLGPDALVLDLIMPGCGGLGVLKRVHELPSPRPAVLLLSAYENRHPAVLQAIMDPAVTQFFAKPIQKNILVEALHLHLKTKAGGAAPEPVASQRLEDNSFFAGFRDDSRARFVAQARLESLPGGTSLFSEGDAADWLYLVLEGQVEMVKASKEGRKVVLATVTVGDFFGELGILGDTGRSTGARTKTPVKLGMIPCAEVRRVLGSESPEVWTLILKRVLRYLRSTNERVIEEIVHKEKIQLIGEMAGSIIHDFKNPLAGIQLAARMIMEENGNVPVTVEFCKIILQQADRMVGMAQELLEFSQGQPRLELRRLRVDGLFDTFRQLNEQYLKESSVKLSVEPADAEIAVDMDRFLRVLQNLVGNAVDAMAPGGGEVSLRAARSNGSVEILVADTGPGIPEAVRHRVFEPFFTHGKRLGTGLGLSIAKTLVEAHGGTISFTSETGRGTTFRILLPLSA